MPNTPRIVIVGGGFAGVYTARSLEKALRPAEAEICLINRENYFVFQPLLPEVISGAVGLVETVTPIRRICPRTNLYTRYVDSIDFKKKVVRMAPTLRPRALELSYDYLVLCPGTVTDYSGMPGLAEYALSFRTLGDALRLRNRALESLEEAATEKDLVFRERLLTFVISGGGFSGVEVAAELNDFLRTAVKAYHPLTADDLKVMLVHSRDRILPEMSPELATYAQKILSRRGVVLKLNARVKSATAETVTLNTGEVVNARTLVSTVPSVMTPLVSALECEKQKGLIVVNGCLEVAGFEGSAWALGDCASIAMADGSKAPPTAQHATREAQVAAFNIAVAIRGKGVKKAFHFPGLGKLASLGHHSAVAEVFGIKISGLPAWILWRTIYLMKMPGLDRKLRVGLDWLTGAIFKTDLVQLRVETSSSIIREHFDAGQIVFEQGDAADRLFIIQKGAVEVLRDGVSIAKIGEGESFGEMGLLTNSARNATVRATKSTDLVAIAKSDITQLLANFPELRDGLNAVAEDRNSSRNSP